MKQQKNYASNFYNYKSDESFNGDTAQLYRLNTLKEQESVKLINQFKQFKITFIRNFLLIFY
jgi:hypothetical protein